MLTQAPVVVALWQTRGRWLELPERLLVGVALWPLALAAAFAYGRGTGAGEIAVRYMDPLSVGLVTNAIVLAYLLGRSSGGIKALGLGALWLCVIGAALICENEPAKLRGNFEGQLDFYRRQRAVVTAYLAHNDPRELERDPLVRQYFPHFDQTRDLLADPLTRLALPASLAAPLALQRDPVRSTPGTGFEVIAGTENNARVLTLRGGARGAMFVSQPIADDLRPVWRLRVSGKVGSDAGEIALLDEAGREHPPLDAAFDASGTWKTVNFLRGLGRVRLIARVPAGQELRLTEPLELGRLSWLAPKFTATWAICLFVGVAAFAFGAWRDRNSARS